MKQPPRLLQVSTLALFASMIGGLVFYQSGGFKREQTMAQNRLLPTGWFDSVQFQTQLELAQRTRSILMPGSKVALVFKPVEMNDFSPWDTLAAVEILQMRYGVAKLSLQDALIFQTQFNQRDIRTGGHASIYDSLSIWNQLKFYPQRVVQLTPEKKRRFQIILDSLPTYGLDYKSRLLLHNEYDIARALKILTVEQWPR